MSTTTRSDRARAGLTLVETLVTLLLVTLATTCVATGTSFAVRQYRESRTQSEGRMLLSTLRSAVEGELVGATTVTLAADGSVESFFNSVYGDSSITAVTVSGGGVEPTDGFGQLYVGRDGDGRLLVGSAAYSSYGLGARLTHLDYDADAEAFHVGIEVGRDGRVIDSAEFDVRPVNRLVVFS